MTKVENTLNCYTKLLPKWVALVVFLVGIAGIYALPVTSLAFYLWEGLCLIIIVKTMTQKQEKEPLIVIDEIGIKLDNKQFYSFKEIEKVMAYSSKKMKFRSVNFKLFLKKGNQVEFCVDDLNIKPQHILDVINERIKL